LKKGGEKESVIARSFPEGPVFSNLGGKGGGAIMKEGGEKTVPFGGKASHFREKEEKGNP